MSDTAARGRPQGAGQDGVLVHRARSVALQDVDEERDHRRRAPHRVALLAPARLPYYQTGPLFDRVDKLVDTYAEGMSRTRSTCPSTLCSGWAGLQRRPVPVRGVRAGGFRPCLPPRR